MKTSAIFGKILLPISTIIVTIAAYLASCSDSSSSGGGTTFTVGGSISGLSGTVVLQNNTADDLSITASGNFTFATGLADKASYAVTVKTQPTSQTCTVTSGSGTIASANITNVSVSCVTASSGGSGGEAGGGSGGGSTSPIKMFVTSAAFTGNMSGRTGLDQRCDSSSNKPASCPTSVRAFISVSASDEIRDMPTLYSVPTSVEIQSTGGTKIADTWADLLDGSIDTSIATAGVTSDSNYWTGSDQAGALNGGACLGWTDAQGMTSGIVGSSSDTTTNWLGTGSPSFCNTSLKVLCLCY